MITIRDIAEQAGVSVSTASRALNDNPRISMATRRKIQSLASRLGYVPNYNAKSLTRGEANVVGVVFPPNAASDQENPFFIDAMRGINTVLMSRHYVLSVAIGQESDDVLANVVAMVDQAKVKRFILLYAHEDDPVADYLRQAGLRFVIIGQPSAAHADDYVDNDNVAAGAAGASYLIDRLHVNRPVFVGSVADWPYEQNRRRGFMGVAVKRGVPTLQVQLPHAALADWLSEHDQIDGILASDDLIGLAFYQQWQQLHPHDQLPVVSYNRSVALSLPNVMFHSIDLYPERLGAAAAELVFRHHTTTVGEENRLIVPFETLN
ncbi:LacI family DNA-binding transcriptional regulator [Furfurilactobacillus sp. WILCCON 0119]|uniref:LacI family DNA-binding transcriptional regulator n=1 Tax=Furfurilactobacillus entadae TaxID=2922307 RepID=UPI0035E7E4C1